MSGVSEFSPLSKGLTYKGKAKNKTKLDPKFKVKMRKFTENKRFRVSDQDLLEFNEWMKSRFPKGEKPRLFDMFDSEDAYEDYMLRYQQEHMTLTADPAVLKTDKHGRIFSAAEDKEYLLYKTKDGEYKAGKMEDKDSLVADGNKILDQWLTKEDADKWINMYNNKSIKRTFSAANKVADWEVCGHVFYRGVDNDDVEVEVYRNCTKEEAIERFNQKYRRANSVTAEEIDDYIVYKDADGKFHKVKLTSEKFEKPEGSMVMGHFNSKEEADKYIKEYGNKTFSEGKKQYHIVCIDPTGQACMGRGIGNNKSEAIEDFINKTDPEPELYRNKYKYVEAFVVGSEDEKAKEYQKELRKKETYRHFSEDSNKSKYYVLLVEEDGTRVTYDEDNVKDINQVIKNYENDGKKVIGRKSFDGSEEGRQQAEDYLWNKYGQVKRTFSEDKGEREKVSAEMLEKAKEDGVVQKKPNGAWGIISIQAGEWWIPDYDTKENAEAALAAYHANKSKTFSTEEVPQDAKKVVVYTSNPEQLNKILTAIQEAGNPGHSFEIVIDPELTEAEGGNQKFGWDGDGSDRIYKIDQEEQKNLDKNFADTDKYCVIQTGGSIGENSGFKHICDHKPCKLIKDNLSKEDAMQLALSRKHRLTKFEKEYYDIKYHVVRQDKVSENKEFSASLIQQNPISGKWIIEGTDQEFDTEEDAKIFLATVMVKGGVIDLPEIPEDTNFSLKDSEVGAVVMKSKDGGYYVVSIENDEDWKRIASYKKEGDKLIRKMQSTGEADGYIDDHNWNRYQS